MAIGKDGYTSVNRYNENPGARLFFDVIQELRVLRADYHTLSNQIAPQLIAQPIKTKHEDFSTICSKGRLVINSNSAKEI